MIRSAKRTLSIVTAGCLLLPILAQGESSVGPEAQRSARVLFKIVIPQVLFMEIADGERAPRGQALAISSNDRNVLRVSTAGMGAERHHVLLSSAGHRSIVEFAACIPADRAQPAFGMSCTVSMP
jgi:hypothetical protein